MPTLAIAYGFVMPRHGFSGVNELTIGFGSAVLGACITYVVGLRAALARRAAADGDAGHRWRRPEFIARQSARPHGLIGHMIGRIMRAETRAANNATIQLADIKPNNEVVDIGCGPGYAVERMAEQLTTSRVVGADASTAMVRMAARRNGRYVKDGRVVIAQADAERLPLPSASVDRVLATHVVYFWTDLDAVARELRRILKPEGVLVFCLADPDVMRQVFPASVYRLRQIADIAFALEAAGLAPVTRVTRIVAGQPLIWLLVAPGGLNRVDSRVEFCRRS